MLVRRLQKIASYLDKVGKIMQADIVDSIMSRCAMSEYWFTPDEVIYADGDIGDYNHDMIAYNHFLNENGYDLSDETPYGKEQANMEFSRYLDRLSDGFDDYKDYLVSIYGDEWDRETTLGDYLGWIKHRDLPSPDRENKIKEFYDNYKQMTLDPRGYAIQNYPWQRIQGKNIEVKQLNEDSIQQIIERLEELYDYDDNILKGKTFNIEIHQPKHDTLVNVPWEELLDRSVFDRIKFRPEEVLPAKFAPRKEHNIPFYKYDGG